MELSKEMESYQHRGLRDLQHIVGVFRERGRAAVMDGDAVAVLVPQHRRLSTGVREVHYDVRRVRTLTEAYTAAF
jgi:hypothetical protein